jgi:hypothetical protein
MRDLTPTESVPDESDVQARLDALGASLRRKAEAQIGARREIEDRWIEDLRQYHGRYTEDTETRLAKDRTGSSRIFVNLTRPKCDALEARLSEMLFPSDDRNWAIQPTPSPELAGIPTEAAQAVQQQAKAAADAMQRAIDDQLTETDYGERAKQAIHDAVVFGTGILKGPVISNKTQKQWAESAPGVQVLQMNARTVPLVEVVSPWDFFPDMSARRLEEVEFIFERRYVTRRQLRQLAQRPRYRADAIRATLQDEPRRGNRNDWHRQQLRDVTGVGQSMDETQYEWWEYHGPIDKTDAEALGIEMPDDPLIGLEVIIEFVGDRVIRAELHPLDTQDPLYSTFALMSDESTLFGYGIPYLLRAPQTAINAAWRMMLDNAALSVGPQIVINQDVLKPADGVYQLSPRKVWLLNDYTRSVSEAFASFAVNSYQPELMAIFETARRLIEQESNIPDLMQGDLGNTPQQTASGLSMAMNAANTVLRRLVKRWDDEITKTLLRRFYDYNMQYAGDPSIKGDFEVDARGSSALMVKETQSQALMQLIQLAQSPILAPLTKFAALYRKTVETLRLSPDELVYTDDELAAQQQQQSASPDPAAIAQQQQAQVDQQSQQLDYQMHQESLAMQERMKAAELQDKAADRQLEMAKEQMKAEQLDTEARLKVALGSGL